MVEIVGREEELATLGAFVGRTEAGPAALVLEGEAGIGKSTLWSAGVAHARDHGLCVLSSRPAEAERDLAHAGLGDLFEDVLDDVLPALSTPRRRALEVACLLGDAADGSLDSRALGVAVRDVLELLGDRQPIVVAVDDAQWLDRSTSAAIAFALRRLGPSRVLVLLARRLDGAEHRSAPELALGEECVHLVGVGPLSVGALHRVLPDRLRQPFPRQTLLFLHGHSGGNPFYALELARALDTNTGLLEPIAVPETLEGLVRARISGLPGSTREALTLASALGTPSEALLGRAGVPPEVTDGSPRSSTTLSSVPAIWRWPRNGPMPSSRCDWTLPRASRRFAGRPASRPSSLSRRSGSRRRPMSASFTAVRWRRPGRSTSPASGRVRGRWSPTCSPGRGPGRSGRRRSFCSPSWRASTGRPTCSRTRCARRNRFLRSNRQSTVGSRGPGASGGGPTMPLSHFGSPTSSGDDVLVARARAVQALLGWFTGDAKSRDDLALRLRELPDAIGGERLVQEATQAIANTLAPSSRRGEAHALLAGE